MSCELSFTQQIIEIAEREQRRIGQDLHDSLGQILTGIGFISKMLEQKLTAKSLPEAEQAAEITRLVREAVDQTRSLVKALNPVRLNEDGLIFSLEELAFNTKRIFGVTCDFNCEEHFHIKDESTVKNLYRIVQEAINNAIRHGGAKNILIRLASSNPGVTLTIQDDGSGFSDNPEGNSGQGLKIMKCRAKTIGASLDIQHVPGGGTMITCSVY